jgi:hypothetical protein
MSSEENYGRLPHYEFNDWIFSLYDYTSFSLSDLLDENIAIVERHVIFTNFYISSTIGFIGGVIFGYILWG